MPTRVSIDEDAACADAALGMSLEGVAHGQGCARMTLQRYRQAHPDFNARLMAALASFERGLLKTYSESALDPQTIACATGAQKMLAQRFPQRHGIDPRLRLDARQAQEGYAEDLEDPSLNPAQDGTAAVIGRLVERMLREDEAPSE